MSLQSSLSPGGEWATSDTDEVADQATTGELAGESAGLGDQIRGEVDAEAPSKALDKAAGPSHDPDDMTRSDGSGDLVVVPASKRIKLGKSAARKVRKSGLLPGNFLLAGGTSQPITLEPKWLAKIWTSGGKLILKLDGQEHVVKIHEIQIDPVRRAPVHVDVITA